MQSWPGAFQGVCRNTCLFFPPSALVSSVQTRPTQSSCWVECCCCSLKGPLLSFHTGPSCHTAAGHPWRPHVSGTFLPGLALVELCSLASSLSSACVLKGPSLVKSLIACHCLDVWPCHFDVGIVRGTKCEQGSRGGQQPHSHPKGSLIENKAFFMASHILLDLLASGCVLTIVYSCVGAREAA